ncbi:hypothetical protein [Qipengyuania sp.]|uniref:hypothetical protein n=1 Tax=Qipengyuania sp. TaxID=2004515 RepID=UPI0035C7E2AF
MGWQTVIADLALILFLVTAGAAKQDAELGKAKPVSNPALSKWAEGDSEQPLGRWLADQPADPRTTVVMTGRYAEGDRARIWNEASRMESVAKQRFERVRTVVLPSGQTGWSARLIYDGQATR